jgi:mRNA interferase MazF
VVNLRLGNPAPKTSYVPDRGDIIWLNFSPQAGFEQAGRRPALVLSPQAYNAKTGRCVVCPITSKRKGYPFEHGLPADCGIEGVVLIDHIKNQDWISRDAEFAARITKEWLDPICDVIEALIRPE